MQPGCFVVRQFKVWGWGVGIFSSGLLLGGHAEWGAAWEPVSSAVSEWSCCFLEMSPVWSGGSCHWPLQGSIYSRGCTFTFLKRLLLGPSRSIIMIMS